MEAIKKEVKNTVLDVDTKLSLGDIYSIGLILQAIMMLGAGPTGVAGFIQETTGIHYRLYASLFIAAGFLALTYKGNLEARGWLLMPIFVHTAAAFLWSVVIGLGNAHPVPMYLLLCVVLTKTWWLGDTR